MRRPRSISGKREFLEIGRLAGRFPIASSKRGGRLGELSVWCSNDYLGMGQHPLVRQAMKRAVHEFGASSGGSRNIGGTNHYHVLLENELADLRGREDALLFTSGYSANDGARSVLAGQVAGCVVYSDELNPRCWPVLLSARKRIPLPLPSEAAF
jgi:5-aminolevulinate synthase